jgi:hypothetical protein
MFDRLKSLYLAWQSPSPHRRWYPVGLLEFERISENSGFYRFGYLKGAMKASHEAGFCPIDSFPDFNRSYESAELFPLFQNRVMDDKRAGFSSYLESLALPPEYREPIHILAVTGGRRRTDSFEVFPRIEPATGGHFELTFFLHGTRYCGVEALKALQNLKAGDPLAIAREPRNHATSEPALRIETEEGVAIGYTPNYLVPDFCYMMENCIYDAEVSVERINSEHPLDSRILLRIAGCWPEAYEAMIPEDFRELAPAVMI